MKHIITSPIGKAKGAQTFELFWERTFIFPRTAIAGGQPGQRGQLPSSSQTYFIKLLEGNTQML